MTRATTVVLLALFCVVAVGCGAAMEEQRAAASAPTANAAGTWTGTAGSGVSYPVTLLLSQTGTDLTGDLSVAGRPDMSGPVRGTVQGELVRLSLATTTFAQMRVQQDTMTGRGSVGPINLRRSK
jgi:hypothetical protein